MRSRVLFALRTLVGPWLAVPAAFIETANLVQRSSPWRGETMWSLEWVAITLFVLGPLATGFAAVDSARLAGAQNAYLVIPTRRPKMSFIRAAAWCAVPLMVIHTVAYAAAVIVGGAPVGTVFRFDMVLQLVVQLAAIAWFVAIGSLIGRFSPPVLAGLAGAIVGLLLFYGLSGSGLGSKSFSLLDLGGATVTQLGWRYQPDYLLLQAAVLLVSAALAFAVPLTFRHGRAQPGAFGFAVIGIAFVAIALAQLGGPDSRKDLVAAFPPDQCYEWSPTICVYSYYEGSADEIAVAVNELVDAADAAGYSALVPDRVEQESYNYQPADPTVRSFFLDPSDMTGETWVQDLVIQGMVIPRCPELVSETGPPEAYWTDLTAVVGTWSVLSGRPDPSGMMQAGDELSPQQVASILDRWQKCDLGASQ